jgi:hypothetical protein
VYAFWVAYVFIGCYTLEMLLKLLGLGFRDSVLPVGRNHGRKICESKVPERIVSGRKIITSLSDSTVVGMEFEDYYVVFGHSKVVYS